jgi:hypothetical protein
MAWGCFLHTLCLISSSTGGVRSIYGERKRVDCTSISDWTILKAVIKRH